MKFSLSDSGDMPGDDAGKEQPADGAVRAELSEAIGRIVGVDARGLPVQLDRRSGQPDPEPRAQPGGDAGDRPQHNCGAIEREQKLPGPRAERQGRGFDADPRIVLLVLMGVDRVVAEGPHYAAEIEEEWRPGQCAGYRG